MLQFHEFTFRGIISSKVFNVASSLLAAPEFEHARCTVVWNNWTASGFPETRHTYTGFKLSPESLNEPSAPVTESLKEIFSLLKNKVVGPKSTQLAVKSATVTVRLSAATVAACASKLMPTLVVAFTKTAAPSGRSLSNFQVALASLRVNPPL